MLLTISGAGLIGSHFVDALVTFGEEPVVLDNLANGQRENLPGGVKLVESDIAAPGVVDAISPTCARRA